MTDKAKKNLVPQGTSQKQTTMLTLFILIGCYTKILSVFHLINRRTPGIADYQNPRTTYLPVLLIVHVIGIILILLSTWVIESPPFFLLQFPDKVAAWKIFSLLTCLLTIPLLPWKKWDNVKSQLTGSKLTFPEIVFYAFSRIIFLIAYEWFFRGLLLFNLLDLAGTAWAVTGNIFLYTLAHFHKSRKEIIGCIPFGLLLCLFTIWWQSVWPAVIIHLSIAAINEWPPVSRFLILRKRAAL